MITSPYEAHLPCALAKSELLDYSQAKLSLELNANSISEAVDAYIDHKVSELTQLKQNDGVLQRQVRDQLYQKANGTFLRVALVCKELRCSMNYQRT